MIRAGLILLMMAGAIQPAHADCIGEDKDHVVLARQGVTLNQSQFPAVIRQLVGDPYPKKSRSGLDRFYIKGIEVSIFGDGVGYPCDAPLLVITADQYSTARVDALNFPWFQGFDVVSQFVGASGSSFQHRLFARQGESFVEVSPPGGLTHTNVGGFFFGPLGRGRGNGFALWDADWSVGGAHYDPRPYKGAFQRWDGAAFQPAGEMTEPDKHRLGSSKAPDFLGLPKGTAFDQTMPYTEMTITRDPMQ